MLARLTPLLYFAVAALLLWVPGLRIPFGWVGTFFHELSHGIAALLTGGSVLRIQLFFDGSGVLTSAGSWFPPLVSFAGYFGAALWGWLIWISATPRFARTASTVLAVLVLVVTVLWARDLLTVCIQATLAVLFALSRRSGGSELAHHAVRIIAATVLLDALGAPLNLMHHVGPSDAATLARATLIPRIVWILVWEALAIWVTWRVVSRSPRSA